MSVTTPAASPVSSYVQLAFTTDPNDLADQAVAYLQTQWTGWQPDDADLSVVMIEALAPMAANVAQLAANMPAAALIALGTKLLGIPYQVGVSASAAATFTVSGTPGTYDIPAGGEVDISNVAFQTTADLTVTIAVGQTTGTGTVTIAANDPGSFANGLDGTEWTPVNLPVYVTNMTLGSPTLGGIDPQDDTDYLNTVAQDLQLRSRSLITLIDFEIAAVTTQGIARAVAVASGSNPRQITVYVADSNGNVVASSIKSTLSTTYAGARMVNATITVADPTYDTVSITYTALALPGQDATALQTAINAALDLEMSPAGYGAPSATAPGLTWVEQPVIHLNKLIGIISNVPGCDYCVSASISASNIGQLSGAGLPLSTSVATTSLPVAALTNAIASGASITTTDPTGAHTDTWTTTAAVAVGATAIPVTSRTASYAYPTGSIVGGPIVGDLTMPATAGNLPQAGTMTGTIQTPVA